MRFPKDAMIHLKMMMTRKNGIAAANSELTERLTEYAVRRLHSTLRFFRRGLRWAVRRTLRRAYSARRFFGRGPRWNFRTPM